MEPERVLNTSPLLRVEPRYGAFVCLTCENGFPQKHIVRHLRTHFKVDVYGPVLKSFEYVSLALDWKDLRLPPDGLPPVEGLKVRRGHLCLGCDHRTTSGLIAKRHFGCRKGLQRVQLQCWNPSGGPKYWIVTIPSENITDNLSTSQTGLPLQVFQ